MGFQGTYVVYNLNLDNTYAKLQKSDHVGGLDIIKGNAEFWLKINKDDRVNVQVSKKGKINIWHPEETFIYGAVNKLKPLVVNIDGKKCKDWTLKKMQMLGSKSIATSLTGEVKPLIATKIKDANPDVIREYTKIINVTNSSSLLHSKLDQLRRLSWDKRVGHYPEVLACLKRCFENPLVIGYPDTYYLLLNTCQGIFAVEQKREIDRSLEPNKIEDEIRSEISQKVICLLEEKPKLLRNSLIFLGQSRRKEAVDLIFKQIDNDPLIALEGAVNSVFYDLAQSLASLYNIHGSIIDKYFIELITADEDLKIKVGQELLKKMLDYNREMM